MKTTITLYRHPAAWFAHYMNGDLASEIFKLFGAHSIPTAFASDADPEVVLAEIKKLNPSCNVFIQRKQEGEAA